VGLRRGNDLEPAHADEVLAGGFDTAQVQAKDLSNPGGFAPAAANTAWRLSVVIEAPDEVSEDGGDDGSPTAQSEQAERGARDGHPSVEVRDAGTQGGEVREVGDAPQRGGSRRKRDVSARPGQQAAGFQVAEGGSEVRSPHTPDERVELRQSVVREVGRWALAAPGYHFLAGEPDAEVSELNVTLAIDPPQEIQDLDGEEHKAPVWLPRLTGDVYRCGRCHGVPSLVRADMKILSASPCESSITRDLAQKIPTRLAILS